MRTLAALLIPAYVNLALPIAPTLVAATEASPATRQIEEAPPIVRTATGVKANRKQPVLTIDTPQASPLHAFSVPLVAVGVTPPAAEQKALLEAVSAYLASQDSDRSKALYAFLDKYPSTAYGASLELNLGLSFAASAYFSRALGAFESAWNRSKTATDVKARAIADRAFGELVHLHARLGHMQELETLFDSVKGRDFTGSATELVDGARQGLGMMKVRPGDSFKCGPAALNRIYACLNKTSGEHAVFAEAKSTTRGINLAEVHRLAQKAGMKLQIAKRTPGAPLLFPSVVHWKVGHYAALIEEHDGIITVQDPTFGPAYAVSRQAIDDEASGYFLVREGALPNGWSAVALSDAATVWGRGQANPADPRRTTDNDRKTNDDCGKGMAVAGAHLLVVSLNISDQPIGYTPPVGSDIAFRVVYNQREANQEPVFNHGNLGPKWNTNWHSYISILRVGYLVGPDAMVVEDYPIVHLPNGGTEAHFPAVFAAGAPLIRHPDSNALMTKEGDGWVRNAADGSKMVFRKKFDVRVASQTSTSTGTVNQPYWGYFLEESIDASGNRVLLTYDSPTVNGAPSARLRSITDAIGQVSTIDYDLSGDVLKVTKFTDPFGRFATFGYDANGRLERITDTINLSSQFTYQGAGDFINSMTTPYGTSSFAYSGDGIARWLELTDPLGVKERVEFPLATAFATGPVPTGMGAAHHFTTSPTIGTSVRWPNLPACTRGLISTNG